MRELVYLVISPHRGSSERDLQKLSRCFDWFIAALIIISSSLAFVSTFELPSTWKSALMSVEKVILWIFTVEYLMRVATADLYYKSDKKRYEDEERKFRYLRSVWKYIWSPLAVIDLLAILPLWIPTSIVRNKNIFMALRLLRVARLLRYVQRYEKVLDNMLSVVKEQRKELKVSLIAIGTLMMIASVLMYAAEHDVQPEKFKNAFSGLWWAVTTITTLGYGDLTPVTTIGRFCGAVIALAGVASLAVPTAIISSGFMKRSITPDDLQKMLSQKDAQQDKVLEKQGKMIDGLTKRFADFEMLQTNRLAEFERHQNETDARQDKMLENHGAVVGELSRHFEEFVRHQDEIDRMQNGVLEQQKDRINQFTEAEAGRFAGLEVILTAIRNESHDDAELQRNEMRQFAESTGSQFAEITSRQNETDRKQDEMLSQQQGMGQLAERFVGLERQLESQRQTIEQIRQLVELHFMPVEKPEGAVKKTMKRMVSGLTFWKKKDDNH